MIDNETLDDAKKSVRELTESFRNLGRMMVDPDISKADRFFTWVVFDNTLALLNNRVQTILEGFKES